MSGLPKKSYIITFNNKPLMIVHSSGAHALLVMDDLRNDHFEEIFGVDMSAKTQLLEEQYEEEYTWDAIEVDTLMPSEAELRAGNIAKRKMGEQ